MDNPTRLVWEPEKEYQRTIDRFAAFALMGILSRREPLSGGYPGLAEEAYIIANEMMAERHRMSGEPSNLGTAAKT